MHSTSLVIHPIIAQAERRVATLRAELESEFDRHIELNFEILPALRHRYDELFGELERRVQEQTLDLTRRKRMVELFALKLDRGEKLDARMVELVMKAVGNEFGRLRSRVDRAVDRERRTERSRGARAATEAMDDSPRRRADELRGLYRRLARRLHPDAVRDDSAYSRHYWDLVQSAYLHGDIGLLRTLVNLVGEPPARSSHGSLEALQAEERRLMTALHGERSRLNALTSIEPYSIREGLDDPEWIASRRSSLESELALIDTELAKCNRFLDPILEKVKAGAPPEVVENLFANFAEMMYINNR